MSFIRTRGREDSFKFKAGNNIRETAILICIIECRIIRLKTRRKDDGTNFYFDFFILLGKINCPYTTELGTYLTASGLEVDALASINGWCVGYGLGIGHIDGFSSCKPHIIFRGMGVMACLVISSRVI